MQISQILDKIDGNQLFVPAFQREYVWKKSDAKELIASLIKEYPTGTMLTWETNHPPELKGDWKYNSNQGAVKLILDGQQRITTLYMLVRGKIPPYYKPEDIRQDTRNLYVNVETLELQYYKKTLMASNPLWVNLTLIFEKDKDKKVKSWDVAKLVSDERKQTIFENFEKISLILSRDFVEQTIPITASIKEAIDIFYVVNASGVNLTDAELALAQICGYWPDARDLFKAKLSSLAKEGFDFKLDFLVYVMLGVLHHMGSDMRKLHTPDNASRIKEAWELLDGQVLDYVMNILRSHAHVEHTKEINSVYALIPIIVYCFDKGKTPLSTDETNRIIKWFYYSQIRQRYVSQMPQKLDRDLRTIAESETPFDELLNTIELERSLLISPDEFEGAGTSNALWSLMRWYFKSRNAVCFTTGMAISQNMGKKYVLESDHIFAYSLLKENGYSRNNRRKYSLAQEITNRAVLTQAGNRTKSNREAKDYLPEVRAKFPNALQRQSIPSDSELWTLENFEVFLIRRRKMLAQELNAFLENITKTNDTEVETSIEDLIAAGESADLELKSSLRWSYQESALNKRLEAVIMKSIAAFSNADGGILLIGVNDEGEVLGLENDYSTLHDGTTKDEFELHLRNLINQNFGVLFAANNLVITFSKAEDKEICKIEVKPAIQPKYLTVNDNGKKTDKLYVRNGNTSIELPLAEVAPYVQSRFG